MNSLADAWEWHQATKRSLARMQRLGARHWDDPSLEGASVWQDDLFRTLVSADIVRDATASLALIDDLAVVVLFSVFESLVRDYLVRRIKPEAAALSDPILRQAAEEAVRGVEEGSFYLRVLGPLKDQKRVSADLVTQVDQVRDYRNWVAHGRRETPTNNVTPQMAYDRLGMFLDALDIAVESEHIEPSRE